MRLKSNKCQVKLISSFPISVCLNSSCAVWTTQALTLAENDDQVSLTSTALNPQECELPEMKTVVQSSLYPCRAWCCSSCTESHLVFLVISVKGLYIQPPPLESSIHCHETNAPTLMAPSTSSRRHGWHTTIYTRVSKPLSLQEGSCVHYKIAGHLPDLHLVDDI